MAGVLSTSIMISFRQRLKIWLYWLQRRKILQIFHTNVRTHERQTKMCQGLFELSGMCDAPITDASSTIDEVLYGEHGAWRGDQD